MMNPYATEIASTFVAHGSHWNLCQKCIEDIKFGTRSLVPGAPNENQIQYSSELVFMPSLVTIVTWQVSKVRQGLI